MTNREKLLRTAEYDVLCDMNENLKKPKEVLPTCIMAALGVLYRSIRCMAYQGNCKDCIREWLNEEAKP